MGGQIPLLEFLWRYIEEFAVITTLVSAVGTILSKLLIEWVRALQKKKATAVDRGPNIPEPAALYAGKSSSGSRTADSAPSPHSIARWHVNVRLKEARVARANEQSSAKVLRVLSHFLTFAQVVVGGVLATSFVQESLSAKSVGIFGVLVLVASLVKQQYHPEVDAEKASQKASKLEALIRFAEDDLTTIDARSSNGENRTDALIDLRDRISRRITEIENPEAVGSQLPAGDLSVAPLNQTPSDNNPTPKTR